MTPYYPSADRSASADRLDQLVAELTAQLEAGREVDLRALVADSPDLLVQLESLLPTLRAVVDLQKSVVASHSAESQETPPQGTSIQGVLGDYRLFQEIGRGGMGVVYEAEQTSLQRRVALKVLPMAGVLDERILRRFKNEAQAAARLKHPHIVSVYAVGCERGIHYYAMELVEGQSLADVISTCRAEVEFRERVADAPDGVDPSQVAKNETQAIATLSTDCGSHRKPACRNAARLGIQVAEALHYAHGEGIIHRDIKPSNILLNDAGRVAVTDFGLAQIYGDDSLTVTGDILGTLRYMSPEQADGARVLDHRTDIYSLGLVLYEMLTLRAAFDGKDRKQLLLQIHNATSRSPRSVDRSIPVDLETIVQKATQCSAADRYQTAQSLADDLTRFLEGKPIRARRVRRWEKSLQWAKRNPTLAVISSLLGAITLLLAVLGPSFAVHQYRLNITSREQQYALYVRSAYEAWDRGNVAEVRRLLAHLVDLPELSELAGFEFEYLSNRAKLRHESIDLHHEVRVDAFDFSPDGKRIVSGDDDGNLYKWDVQFGTLTRRVETTTASAVSVVQYSNDGSRVAVGRKSGQVELRDARDLSLLEDVPHSPDVRAIAFAPDDTRLLTAADKDVAIWHFTTDDRQASVQTLAKQKYTAASVAFASDNRTVAWSGDDGTVVVYDLIESKVVAELKAGHAQHYDLPIAFSPDGSLLAAGTQDVSLWSTAAWNCVGHIDCDSRFVKALSFFQRGNLLACNAGGRIRIIDCDNRVQVGNLNVADTRGSHVRVDPDGECIASGGPNGISLWNRENWYTMPRHNSGILSVASVQCVGTDDTNRVVVAHGGALDQIGGQIELIDVETGAMQQLTPTRSVGYGQIALSPADPDLLAIAYRHGAGVSLWNWREQRPVASFPAGLNMFSIEFSRDGKYLVASELDNRSTAQSVYVWDIQSKEKLKEWSFVGLSDAVFSLDTDLLIVAVGLFGDPQLLLIDTNSWTVTSQVACDFGVACMATNPANNEVAMGCRDGRLTILDLDTRKLRLLKNADGEWVSSIAFSPDGMTLVAASSDLKLSFWSPRRGWNLGQIRLNAPVCNLDFSTDGDMLAIGCVWNGSVTILQRDGRRKFFDLDRVQPPEIMRGVKSGLMN